MPKLTLHATLIALVLVCPVDFCDCWTARNSVSRNLHRHRLFSSSGRSSYDGAPSSPGWKRNQLNRLTDWAVSDAANRPVICEYEPDALWLWSKWRGTVLSIVFLPVVWNIAVSIGVDVLVHSVSPEPHWPFLAKPPVDNPIIMQLSGVNTLWSYQVTLCTFVLTFFTAEAYKHWRAVYFTTRAIQGRINDVCLLLSVGAKRNDPDAQNLVDRCTRLIKKSHAFFWAATPTCSNGVGDGGVGDDEDDVDLPLSKRQSDTIGPLLLSPYGLQKLVETGELTQAEARALVNSDLPPSQYSYVLLDWVGIAIMEGLDSGLLGHSHSADNKSKRSTLANNSGLEENLLRQLTSVRAEYFSIGDYTAGRMPLAYVQLVQVLVDSLVFLAPFALYSELGALAAVLTGLLTLFFKGLLELSKSFLDPFGNEGYPGQNIRVDVLVSELNYGASSRWNKAAKAYPDE